MAPLLKTHNKMILSNNTVDDTRKLSDLDMKKDMERIKQSKEVIVSADKTTISFQLKITKDCWWTT
jgi:hypothetical protein